MQLYLTSVGNGQGMTDWLDEMNIIKYYISLVHHDLIQVYEWDVTEQLISLPEARSRFLAYQVFS